MNLRLGSHALIVATTSSFAASAALLAGGDFGDVLQPTLASSPTAALNATIRRKPAVAS